MTKYIKVLACITIPFIQSLCFGAIHCATSEDGQTVTCWFDPIYSDSLPPDIFGGGAYNPDTGELTCTNCVAMTPDNCNSILRSIRTDIENIKTEHSAAIASLNQARSLVVSTLWRISRYEFHEDWYQGTIANPTASWMRWNTNQYATVWSQTAQVQDGVCDYPEAGIEGGIGLGHYTRNIVAASKLYGCINGVANLADDVEFYLQDATNHLDSLEGNLITMDALRRDIQSVSDRISCQECTLQSSLASSPGGGGDTGQTGGLACQCKEVLERIEVLITSIKTEIERIRQRVDSIDTEFKNFSQNFDSYAGFVTNFVSRVDDYVFNDFSNQIYQISVAVQGLSNSNALQQIVGLVETNNLYLQDQLFNATLYTSLQNGVFVPTEDQVFNEYTEQEYPSRYAFLTNRYLTASPSEGASTNWFERMEILLAALVFPSSSTNVDLVSSNKSTTDEWKDRFSATLTDMSFSDEIQQNYASLNNVGNTFVNTIRRIHQFCAKFRNLPSHGKLTFGEGGGDSDTFDGSPNFDIDLDFSSGPFRTFVEMFRTVTTFVICLTNVYVLWQIIIWTFGKIAKLMLILRLLALANFKRT